MIYAMILRNRVIGILKDQVSKPNWPNDPQGDPVIAVECNETIELGMGYNFETKEFGEYIPTENDYITNIIIEHIPEPTQLDRIEEAINKSKQEIIDEYTLALIEGGIL
jgi:hypothetical protein